MTGEKTPESSNERPEPGPTTPGPSLTPAATVSLERDRGAPLTRATILAMLATAAMLAVGWYKTFYEMWMRWYPAWQRQGYTLTERLTEGDSYYSHGPLVPLTSLIIAIYIYRRVGLPTDRSRRATVLGWLLLLGSIFLHLISVYARVTFTSGFALVGVLGGLVLLYGGFALARAYWLPVAFLVFMVPLPMNEIANLNFRLKSLASAGSVWLVGDVFGIPLVKDGSYVHLQPAADGTPKQLVIENVCGGLRSLISLTCFAALFALICRVKGIWRAIMLLLALPLAVLCNVIRIASLILVAHFFSVEAAGPDGWYHGFSGIVVFLVALGILFGLEWLVIRLATRFRRNWVDERLLGYLESAEHTPGTTLRAARPTVLVLLVATVALSLFWYRQSPAMPQGKAVARILPTEITIDGDRFTSYDLQLDQQTLTILETNDYVYRRFEHRPTHREVDFLIVFSENNRKGTHPPEVCIKGSGEEIYAKQVHALMIDPIGEVDMRELLSQRDDVRSCFLYTYKCGQTYTPDFLNQQFRIFLRGLTGQSVTGALIRLTTTVQNNDNDAEAARKLVTDAAEILMPALEQNAGNPATQPTPN